MTQYLAWVQDTLPSGHSPVVMGTKASTSIYAHRMSPFTREAGQERRLPPGFSSYRGR